MKVPAKELFEVVRQVVREEVRKVLPELVREHLTETYMRRMVLEVAGKKGNPVSELLTVIPQVDEEEIPEPQSNSDLGIYNPATLTKPENRRNEVTSKLMARNNPMAFVYEDVNLPPPMDETGAPLGSAEEGIQFKPDAAPEFARMNRLVEALENKAADKRPLAVSAEAKMRELEMKRKALDVPVGSKTR